MKRSMALEAHPATGTLRTEPVLFKEHPLERVKAFDSGAAR